MCRSSAHARNNIRGWPLGGGGGGAHIMIIEPVPGSMHGIEPEAATMLIKERNDQQHNSPAEIYPIVINNAFIYI
jgi:hypothetical protein